MSRKTVIYRMRYEGAPFFVSGTPADGHRSLDPYEIASYLVRGYRYAFNQARETRYLTCVRHTHAQGKTHIRRRIKGLRTKKNAIPLPTERRLRQDHVWLRNVPSRTVLHAALRDEGTEWVAAWRRRKTLLERGEDASPLPTFRSRKDASGNAFDVFRDHDKGCEFQKLNRNRGVLIVRGRQDKALRKNADDPLSWTLKIYVRLKGDLPDDWTSARVNVATGTVAFVSPPSWQRKVPSKDAPAIGLDLGVAATIATSDGQLLHKPELSEKERRHLERLERKRARQAAAKARLKRKTKSNSQKRVGAAIARLEAKQAARRYDWAHKVTTRLVEGHPIIAIEDLDTKSMTARPEPEPDPSHENAWLPNGAKAKAGLNQAILESNWGALRAMLAYKTKAAGTSLILVNPAYTSQTCSACGHVARESRESQAEFRCVACGHAENADVNAAKNILARALGGPGHGPATPGLGPVSETRDASRRPAPPRRRLGNPQSDRRTRPLGVITTS